MNYLWQSCLCTLALFEWLVITRCRNSRSFSQTLDPLPCSLRCGISMWHSTGIEMQSVQRWHGKSDTHLLVNMFVNQACVRLPITRISNNASQPCIPLCLERSSLCCLLKPPISAWTSPKYQIKGLRDGLMCRRTSPTFSVWCITNPLVWLYLPLHVNAKCGIEGTFSSFSNSTTLYDSWAWLFLDYCLVLI